MAADTVIGGVAQSAGLPAGNRRDRGRRQPVHRLGLAGAVVLAALLPAAAYEHGPSQHLRALAEIATQNGGNRAAGTPGYDKSAAYVAERLRAVGYVVHVEEFTFPYVEERSGPALSAASEGAPSIVPEGALRTLSQSGSCEVVALLRHVDLGLVEGQAPGPSNSGCEPEDFAGFERGQIALVRRGTCPFQAKIENAEVAGAAAVVIMNEGTPDRLERFGGALARPASIPVVGIPFEQGRQLAMGAQSPVRVKVDVVRGTRTTRNVWADTSSGNPAETVVIEPTWTVCRKALA